MSKVRQVGDLFVGQVISLPETGLMPSVITAVSDPIGDVRFIELTDLESGQPVESTQALSVQRKVHVHDVLVAHHHYTNETSDPSQ